MNQFIAGLFQSILILILAFVFVYKYSDIRTRTTHFVCPHCSSRFKLSKLNFAIAFKTGKANERLVTCPVCGHRDRMSILND
jgi:DNA-directed RNA polymerase subunit RPC12/RpoP